MPIPSARSYGPLIRFLLVHAVTLAIVHLAAGWCWVLAYQPNEFAGLGFVIALKATPILILLSTPINAWIWYKAGPRLQHLLAFAVTIAWIGLFNVPYLLYL